MCVPAPGPVGGANGNLSSHRDAPTPDTARRVGAGAGTGWTKTIENISHSAIGVVLYCDLTVLIIGFI